MPLAFAILTVLMDTSTKALRKMNPDDLELHDAVIKRMSVDYEAGTLQIDMDYYPVLGHSSERAPLIISFSGVEKISGIADFVNLKDNSSAGNVGYWHPSTKSGTTYIYLISGLLAIDAKSIEIEFPQ